jgi:hypothetical protein
MIHALTSHKMAKFTTAVHVVAALAILWCFYRVANGHFSLI